MSEWTDFRLSAFGDPYLVWHDGPDFSVLQSRWRDDPELVERMLRLGLAEDDELAAQAVGELRLTGFVPELKSRLATAGAPFTVRLADSLRILTGDQSWAAQLVAVLLSDQFWSIRLDAAIALRHFAPTMELIAALIRGVEAADYLVRYHSANTLLAWSGREPDISKLPEFAQILENTTPAEHTEAAIGLAATAAARLHLDETHRAGDPAAQVE